MLCSIIQGVADMDALHKTFRLFFSIFIFVLFFVLINQLHEGTATNRAPQGMECPELPML